MNFPILSAIIFIPLIGAIFILVTKGSQKNVEKNSKYVAIFSSLANFSLSLFLSLFVGLYSLYTAIEALWPTIFHPDHAWFLFSSATPSFSKNAFRSAEPINFSFGPDSSDC